MYLIIYFPFVDLFFSYYFQIFNLGPEDEEGVVQNQLSIISKIDYNASMCEFIDCLVNTRTENVNRDPNGDYLYEPCSINKSCEG